MTDTTEPEKTEKDNIDPELQEINEVDTSDASQIVESSEADSLDVNSVDSDATEEETVANENVSDGNEVAAVEVERESFEEAVDEDPVVEGVELQRVIEGALFAAGEPLSLSKIQALFEEEKAPSKDDVKIALDAIQTHCDGRGYALKEVDNGWRFFVQPDTARWVNRLWDEKPQKYSRALLETLALIAYRQPLTRGDIEEVRGVAVSSHIIKTLTEREWVKVVGHRDVPGRPALYATTKTFLDYFNLNSLDELPSLGELKDIDSLNADLEFDEGKRQEAIVESAEVLSTDAANDVEENDVSDAAAGDVVDEQDAEPESFDELDLTKVNENSDHDESEELEKNEEGLGKPVIDSESVANREAGEQNESEIDDELKDSITLNAEEHSAESAPEETEEENPNG